MATYYGYAERTASSEVNWAEIGKNLTDTLKEEALIRETKKAEIDEATRQFGKTLSESPSGENGGINRFTTNYADQASQMMLMQERLLKSGMLKFNQYSLVRQNLKDSTNRIFDISRDWQTFSKAIAEGQQPGGDGSLIELENAKDFEGLFNLSNTQAYIDPTNGLVSIAKTKKVMKDGKEVIEMDGDPSNYYSVSELSNFLKTRIKKYDYTADTDKLAKSAADYTLATIKKAGRGRNGEIISIEDARQNPDYQKWLDNSVNSLLTNPQSKASLLVDRMGYTTTFSKDDFDANPKAILKIKNGQGGWDYQFHDDDKEIEALKNSDAYKKAKKDEQEKMLGDISQTEAAKSFLKADIGMKMKRTEEKAAIAPIPDKQFNAAEWESKSIMERSEILGKCLAQTLTGKTVEEVDTGIKGLTNLPGVKYAQKTGTTLTIYTEDGGKFDYNTSNKNLDQIFNGIVQNLVEKSGDKLQIDDIYTFKGASNWAKSNKRTMSSLINGSGNDNRVTTNSTTTVPGGIARK